MNAWRSPRPVWNARSSVRVTGSVSRENSLGWSSLRRLRLKVFREAGRRKLEGRIVGISGESGAEQIEFDYFEVDIARTPRAAALRARKKQTVEAAPVRVVFPLSEVEQAHLLVELNFKG